MHKNGVKSFINVKATAGNDTQVCDRTLNESLSYTLEKDKSITFWVENNHTYSVYLKKLMVVLGEIKWTDLTDISGFLIYDLIILSLPWTYFV